MRLCLPLSYATAFETELTNGLPQSAGTEDAAQALRRSWQNQFAQAPSLLADVIPGAFAALVYGFLIIGLALVISKLRT